MSITTRTVQNNKCELRLTEPLSKVYEPHLVFRTQFINHNRTEPNFEIRTPHTLTYSQAPKQQQNNMVKTFLTEVAIYAFCPMAWTLLYSSCSHPTMYALENKDCFENINLPVIDCDCLRKRWMNWMSRYIRRYLEDWLGSFVLWIRWLKHTNNLLTSVWSKTIKATNNNDGYPSNKNINQS
jgi:hypothetical protein